ncbi:MAG: NAD-dependent succinate-semialdehyde dehydrogenase [Bacteroidetes bacterium]|nr:MAG: NAD-dependent succinate-semialdehyde dehydrogenase [Bacteroidota bacterium]
MIFESVNPYDGSLLQRYQGHDAATIEQVLQRAAQAFEAWRLQSFEARAACLQRAGQLLLANKEDYARTMTLEMGKPIREARGEIEKCAWVCRYYAEEAAGMLADEVIPTEAGESFVRHAPLGPVLAIMPWNFPFWQVFRFAAPNLMAGNTGVLKHAPNVFGCAMHIQQLLEEAGFPPGVFQNLIIHHEQTEEVIAHDAIKAVTLTGSERAGAAVAALAGKYIKKSVLELGGNNACIVLADADLDTCMDIAVNARMQNSGQSCIAAKRFIVEAALYDDFVHAFAQRVSQLRCGNPLEEQTQIGPLARRDLAENLHRQMQQSIQLGARLLLGGKLDGCFFEPAVLTEVQPGMPVFEEETFGPLAAIIHAPDAGAAYHLARNSRFGLGVMVLTQDIERAKKHIDDMPDGAFFVNELVKSDPRLPFGGTHRSGYGRELARDGILEFVNRKTVYIR